MKTVSSIRKMIRHQMSSESSGKATRSASDTSGASTTRKNAVTRSRKSPMPTGSPNTGQKSRRCSASSYRADTGKLTVDAMAKIARRARRDSMIMANVFCLDANQRATLEQTFMNAMVSAHVAARSIDR